MNMDFDDLMLEAYELPGGRAKIALLEKAIKLADNSGNVEQGFEARLELVEAATFNGYPMKALVNFSWLLGQFDKKPDSYDSFNLLWSYKWIMDNVACFPEISRKQIDGLLEDMKQRYREQGFNDRTYDYYRMTLAIQYGELEEAGRLLENIKGMDRDEMSDCVACEQNQFVEYYVLAGNDERAIQTAEPILSGWMSCAEVPHMTYPQVLLPLYRSGRLKEAAMYQRQGYRLIKGNRDFIRQVSEHIAYFTETDPIKGLELFELHVPLAMDHENPHDQMMFNAYASSLFKRLASETVSCEVRLPATFADVEESRDAARLAERFGEMAMAAARKFDHRNGNRYYESFIISM
ncbi:hypothetical protein OIN60_09695 [Paenibacillus sp. P96]|uniref:DUF4034 domain-containing protein n=1 Tax=Paenibacillus zeirhizosphaerae TaxID=2987519 RepID=A0ABT9FQM7_9BACL|nr:hypothetical protein [Paenibacillus sp. P96]MDP4097042.1 hypothetical protein [Paenibacillus sp. P96]